MPARRHPREADLTRATMATVRGLMSGRTRPVRCAACGHALRASEPQTRIGGARLHAACARGRTAAGLATPTERLA
jgi:hypothetical protein